MLTKIRHSVIKQKSLTKPGITVGESKLEDSRFTIKTTATPSLSMLISADRPLNED